MKNNVYIGLGVLILVIIVIIGIIYWPSEKEVISPVLPIEEKLTAEQESLNQDITELENEVINDTSLENLDQNLTEITGESVAINSIENLENKLSLEISSFSSDLKDLEGFESDKSLDNLDSGLSGIIE